ncbi:MAG: hypothetical protein QOH22_1224 [Gemmatimonadaceae bacterium]|jgi:hypothetical protein|nr:hypothetical protein [Gemmatimonadaceae bacterium]
MDWWGVFFASLVIVAAVPFAISQLRNPNSPMRTSGTRFEPGVLVLAGIALGIVNIVRALGKLENDAAYWTLTISLSVLFWTFLLRLSWTERRQRPR